MVVRLIKDTGTGDQYVEVRVFRGRAPINGGAMANTGAWNITNGATFQGTFGTTFAGGFPEGNTSFVLSSTSTGTGWTLTNPGYVDI